jgi:DNA-directed RNA polymerase subunit K/omega
MDYRKVRTGSATITRNLNDFDKDTENIYESLVIISKRANQIAMDMKEELSEKIKDFSASSAATASNEASDEMVENREQMDLAKYYEQIPKPSLIATQEFLNGQVYYRLPEPDEEYIDGI